jgi:gamma-glutamyltranspeptidase/glutathione hydrolase
MSTTSKLYKVSLTIVLVAFAVVLFTSFAYAGPTYKPMLRGKDWMAICGQPLSATAGATIFMQGGNAADAAAAMLAAECVQNDNLGFGGETQTLIYDPNQRKVFGINGCGVAPTGATPEFFLDQGMAYPPEYGPLAAITPGTPGGLMLMLAEFGTMSLKEVLAPAIEMADGYPIHKSLASAYASESYDEYFGTPEKPGEWKYSAPVFRPGGHAPEPGQLFVQKDLANTFRKLVATEQQALAAGKSRKEAIMAALDRFYKGDIAVEFARGSQEGGGLHTYEDLANWKPRVEEPRMTTYKGYEVYKLMEWTQGPVLLQTLNILEGIDLKSMGHNSAEYIHTLYQAMNLAYADRDFYYGDPYFPPKEPMKGLLSKEYAAERRKLINPEKNEPIVGPGDPYPFQGEQNPYKDQIKKLMAKQQADSMVAREFVPEDWVQGTTSIQAADSKGWVVSMTPSGGWPPAYLAGHTGAGMSQRMQSFVVDPSTNPFNVVEPGKIPRVTLSPAMALKDGHPFLSFSHPGGDLQCQGLLQLFLNIVEFGMDVQEAVEAPKFQSYQMRNSFGSHPIDPGRLGVGTDMPKEVVDKLTTMGYKVEIRKPGAFDVPRGEWPIPLTAIMLDWEHQTLMGGVSFERNRTGIAW